MSRYWTCRKCKLRHPRIKQKCPCGHARPATRTAAQRALVDEYVVWAERFGEVCGICGTVASPRRRLDRDHDHRTGKPRGLLCSRCNRALPYHVTEEWLERALAYLRRGAA